MKITIGDQFRNASGDVVTVRGVNLFTILTYLQVGDGGSYAQFTRSEIDSLVASGAWKPIPASERAGVCRRCGKMCEYQATSFVCWECQYGPPKSE